MPVIQPGNKAPDFSLVTDAGKTVTLSKHRGKPVVVYFYPKDDTSGCTSEAIAFTELKSRFEEADCAIIGISPDTVASHEKFKKKHNLLLTLASDSDNAAAKAYGVWVEKSMYGRKYMGIERSTFLIGPDGKIVRIWSKVKVRGHAEEVLTVAAALGCG